MKPAHTLTAGLILLPALFLLGQGGSLTPPGAPAPTMKTLDQIEPRKDLQRRPIHRGMTERVPFYHQAAWLLLS